MTCVKQCKNPEWSINQTSIFSKVDNPSLVARRASLRPRFVASRQSTGVRAFVSPDAVYFTTALVVSAFFLVPDLSMTVAGVVLCFGAVASSIHGVAASLILLIIIGIRNAWDLV